MTIDETTFSFAAGDGETIRAWRWQANPVRAVLQIAHGMGEHSRRYFEPLTPLIASGIAVYANDHRGHGATAASKAELGDFGPLGFAALADDMATLTRLIRSENPGKKIILLGHSMGSFAAQLYVLEHSDLIDGLALSGSVALDLITIPQGDQAALESLNTVSAEPRTPFDWLSRDEREVDRYLADPLCGFSVNEAGLVSMIVSGAAMADPARLSNVRKNLPIYIFAGDQDPVNAGMTRMWPLVRRYRDAGISNLTTDFYAGGRHEMLNETNRDEVVANLANWIEKVIA
jgi:alpha-beta hydrolase superfamily lysophospholipase